MTIPPLSIKDEGGRMKDESAAVWNLLSLHPSARLHPSSLPLTAPVGQHALDALLVGFGDEHVDVECALPLGRLLRQDVARVRVPALDLARVGGVLFGAPGLFRAHLAVRYLPSAEEDRGLTLVALSEPLARVLHLEVVVVLVGAWSELDLLDDDDHLLLLRLARLLLLLVGELAEVDDAADGRVCRRRDLDQVKPLAARELHGLARVHDAELLAVLRYHAHLRHAYPVVYARGGRAPVVRASASASESCDIYTSSSQSSKFQVPSSKLIAALTWNLELGTWNYSFVSARSRTRRSAVSLNSASVIAPMSPRERSRTATLPSSISRSPQTSMKGIFCNCAVRIFAPIWSPRTFNSTRKDAARSSRAMPSAYSFTRSVIGSTATCTGASQRGKAPAYCSMSTPKKRSTEPKSAR